MLRQRFCLALLALGILTFSLSGSAATHAKNVTANDSDDDADADSNNGKTTYYKEAQSGTELRKIRRMAFGLQAAGALGMGGAVLDLNFTPQWGVTTGFGGGQGFQAFEIQGKYVLAGDWLMPYLAFGYARWSSVGKNGYIQATNPPLLGDRILNDSEKASGEFQENFLYPALGLQFTQLTGPWAGTSIYAELTVLMDIGNLVAAPTGALGLLYYF